MNLRNYTSSVPVEVSTGHIDKMLVRAGATHIARFYRDGKLGGILFQLTANGQSLTFRLPAKVDRVRDVLQAECKKPRAGTMTRIAEQAERTAWRLVDDWVSIQLSMIQLEQAEAVEIFFPYLYDGKRDQTLFERMRDEGFKQLVAARTSKEE